MIQTKKKKPTQDKYGKKLHKKFTHKIIKGLKKKATKSSQMDKGEVEDVFLPSNSKKLKCNILFNAHPPIPISKEKKMKACKKLIGDKYTGDGINIEDIETEHKIKSSHYEAEMSCDADRNVVHYKKPELCALFLSFFFSILYFCTDQGKVKRRETLVDSSCRPVLQNDEETKSTDDSDNIAESKFEGFSYDGNMNVHTRKPEKAEITASCLPKTERDESLSVQDEQEPDSIQDISADDSTPLFFSDHSEDICKSIESLKLSLTCNNFFSRNTTFGNNHGSNLLSVLKNNEDEKNSEDVKKPKDSEDPDDEVGTCEKEILNQLFGQSNFQIRPEYLSVFMVPSVPKWHPTRIEDIPWNWLKEEKWRLHTFAKYPHNTAKSAILLAADGFAYIGSGKGSDDKVICYFCCSVKQNWQPLDIISDVHSELDSECSMLTKINCDNVPLTAPANSSSLFPALKRSYQSNASANNLRRNEIEADCTIERPATLVGAQAQSVTAPSSVTKSPSAAATALGQPSSLPYQQTSNNVSSSTVTSNNTASAGGSQSQPQARTSSNGIPQATVRQNSEQSARPAASSSSSATASVTSQQSSVSSSNVTPSRPNTVSSGTTNTLSSSANATQSTSPAAAPVVTSVSRSNTPSASTTTNSSQSGSSGRGPTYNELGIITERPKRYEYAVRFKRLETFEAWPRDHHLKKEDLADAGFYYAGYGDCARCFYCGGGLRNWEDEDDVWVEHARWFPKCAFMRQRMGQGFVDTVQDLNKDHDEISFAMVVNKMGVTAAHFQIDSKETPLKRDPAVKSVIDLGYKEDDVLEAAGSLKESGSTLSADKLFEKLEEDGRYRDKSVVLPASQPGNTSENVSKIKETLADLKEQNNQFRQQTVCKICMDKEVAVVFLPCGHLVSCGDCAAAMKDCPVCRVHVKGIVRAFMS